MLLTVLSLAGSVILKAAARIGLSLLMGKHMEDFLIWVAEKVAASTRTTVDDELVKIVKDSVAESRGEADKVLEQLKADAAKKEEK